MANSQDVGDENACPTFSKIVSHDGTASDPQVQDASDGGTREKGMRGNLDRAFEKASYMHLFGGAICGSQERASCARCLVCRRTVWLTRSALIHSASVISSVSEFTCG